MSARLRGVKNAQIHASRAQSSGNLSENDVVKRGYNRLESAHFKRLDLIRPCTPDAGPTMNQDYRCLGTWVDINVACAKG